jgi:quinol monooxygenase YgiN
MSHVKIMATLLAKSGKAGELEALLFGMAPRCRMEPGNLRWDVWRDQAKADRYVLDELYVDNAAVAAHRETPHFKDYLSKIGDLAERNAFVLDPALVANKNG